jgi:flagellar motor switch protein FliN/FliY
MDHELNKKVTRVFAKAFATSMSEALTTALGTPLDLSVLDNPDLATREGQPLHYRITVDGALHGECFIEFYEPQVAEMCSTILGKPSEPYTDEHGAALEQIISSAMAGMTKSLAAEFGSLSFTVDRAADLAFGGMLVVPLASSSAQLAMPALLYFDGEFMASLSRQPIAGDSEASPAESTNLKLVMDVELNVSLRFGQRQLPLREVLELTSGSVIELDRQVDEPVELLLDGKVIARGEAVIVDGNYGLRVTEVPQPIESLVY